jgi:7-keto-8-aminopelargonate synthetase-like enzyme
MPDIFEKCDDFLERMERMAGDNFDALSEVFYRVYPIANSEPHIQFRGREVLQVATNDYLSLATHPEAIAAATEIASKYGAGTPLGARPLTGTTELHLELERRLAEFRRTESCIVYNLGLGAMSGTVACLVGRKERVFVDEYAHGCLHDGARLARGEDSRFRHNDLDDLERQLRACPPEQAKLIAVDGVYGMSGDLAPLPELVELKKRYGAQLLVDDAHGTGVLGEHGRGTPEHFGVEDEIDLHGGTFAKSFGTFGGYIAGPERVIRYLRFQSPAYVLTKALPASIAAATIVTLDLIQREPERRVKLWENLNALRDGLRAAGLNIGNPQGAVTSIWMRGFRALPVIHELERRYNILANLVLYPAVPYNTSIIRVTLTAAHSLSDVARVIDALSDIHKRQPLQDGEMIEGALPVLMMGGG